MNICALALVLLLDVSSSVNAERYALQKQGLVESFHDPSIQRLMLNQSPGGMAITVFEWATTPRQSINWHHIQTPEDLQNFVQDIENMDRSDKDGVTAIGNALEAGVNSFDQAPCQADRKIIDISGDGSNNSGPAPSIMRDQAQSRSITINGLPILNETEPDLEKHYRTHVVTMDGFVIVSNGFEDFTRALRRKLILEIAQNQQER